MPARNARARRQTAGSLADKVVRRLLEWIFDGIYPPGANLRELRIAREVGVSQATVREALHQLESAGLVTRHPNVGTTVTRLTPKEIRERVELRALLEVMAARLAAERMGEEQFAELERRLAALGSAIVRDSYYEAAQADLNFHRWVWKCSGNETLCRVLEQITVPLFAFISVLRASGLQHLADVTAAHEPLVAALRSRDPLQIEDAFTRGATGFYEEFMKETPSSRRAQAFGMLERVPSARSVAAPSPDAQPAKQAD
jgi:DNA-binding GntR family transcriptional regulator